MAHLKPLNLEYYSLVKKLLLFDKLKLSTKCLDVGIEFHTDPSNFDGDNEAMLTSFNSMKTGLASEKLQQAHPTWLDDFEAYFKEMEQK